MLHNFVYLSVYFGAELDFVLNSTETTIYVYQHKTETNRVHIGFREKSDQSWNLLDKNEGIILKENSQVSYSVENGNVLKEDNSPKILNFFKFNSTGLDLFLESTSENVSVKVGMTDLVTKEVGTVLDTRLKIDSEKMDDFKQYIQEKVYDHVEPPEIYREYKLEHLKFLSPREREQYKEINGM